MNAWLGRIGFVVITGGLFWLFSPSLATMHGQTAYSQHDAAVRLGENSLQMFSTLMPSGMQQVLVLDSQGKSMAVYQIEAGTGKIQLKSARNLQWDLQMEQFNGQAPLPSELRQVQP